MIEFSREEILETIRMVEMENLDVRTVTLGINLKDCSHPSISATQERIYDKITRVAEKLIPATEELSARYGIPVVNKRLSVTPIAMVAECCEDGDDLIPLALAMERAAEQVDVHFIGGFSALVQKGFTRGDTRLINSIPESLSQTERVCSSVNVATTKAGINMDAVAILGHTIKRIAELTSDRDGIGCAKFVVFANSPEDNPFMAGAFHGVGEGETALNVGVSGPGVVRAVLEKMPDASLGEIADAVKKTAFKVTRAGELIGRELARSIGVEFGIVDLSLAPTPAIGDSIANILEVMGLEVCGSHGSTAALALLTDAVKKGGAMASSYVGGLSGAFIPLSEDSGMVEAAKAGALSIEKLEAMTSVCSVGLDMVCIPGDTPPETISAIIADLMAIGVVNNKTIGVRIIPVPGKDVGEMAEYGGLFGRAPVIAVNRSDPKKFIMRGGRIPAPLQSLTN